MLIHTLNTILQQPRPQLGGAKQVWHSTPSAWTLCDRHGDGKSAGARLLCRAGNGDSEASSTQISLQEAYALLGLKEGASYEAVLAAKNRLTARYDEQEAMQAQIEAAYDTIFSSQLKARLSGNLQISNKVRFADVPQPRRAAAPKTLTLPGFGAISVRQLPTQPAASASAGFGVLAAWTLAQGLLAPNPMAAAHDTPGLQLALGLAGAVYVLREGKKVGLGKAFGLALAGLVAGTLAGSAVESWLRVDLVPLGVLSSPGALVGEFSLLGLWAACFFLA